MKLCSSSIYFVVIQSLFAADNTIEEIIAKVNGDIITRSELQATRNRMRAELEAGGMNNAEILKIIAEREKDLLADTIDELLLVQRGKDIGINVESDVSKYLAEIQKQCGIADPDKFQQYILKQTGQIFEDFKNEWRNRYLTQRVMQQEVGGRISIPPRAQLEKHYNENKQKYIREEQIFMREIVISTQGKDAAGIAVAEMNAWDVSARAKKGERFQELARVYSESRTKEQSGELPGFKPADLNPKIARVVFAAERGFVTDPIRVDNAFVVLKVEQKHKAGQATFEEVEQEVMNEIIQSRFQPEARHYLAKLRQEAFLEIKPGYVDSRAVEGKSTAWTDPAQLRPETVTKEEVQDQSRSRRLLWLVPLPGTAAPVKKSPGRSSSQ